MRMIAAISMLATGACMTPVDAGNPPVAGVSGHRCDASAAQGLIGRQATTELGTRALELTGARTIRWIQPGQAVTMDYREDRLNIALDARNRVEQVSCG